MPLATPKAQPGFLSQGTQVQAQNAWFAGNRVRWRLGYLEKIGGWERLTQSAFQALIRRMHAWLDLDNLKNLLVGTDFGLQLLVQDTSYVLGSQFPLLGGYVPATGVIPPGAAFTTSAGSPTVTVAINWTATPGQQFKFLLPVSLGGRIIPAGTTFTVKANTAGGFTFDLSSGGIGNAITTESTFGIRLFENSVAAGVNALTMTWKAHGLSPGSPIVFAQTTTLKLGTPGVWEMVNLTIPAGTSIPVSTVVDADHVTLSMQTYGTGDGLGGTAHQVYDGSQVLINSAGSLFSSQLGIVLGVGQPIFPGDPQAHTWFLGNLGQNGLALATGGALWAYTPPVSNAPFVNLVGGGSTPTAPQHSNGMFTAMPQAQVILFGTETVLGTGVIDPLLLRWSDAGTYDVYTATVSNQAGSYRLAQGSKIVGGIQAAQAALLLTDTDAWSMSYIGPPLVYGFNMIGSGCGLVAPHAICKLGGTVYWLSLKGVWSFGPGGLQQLPCSVYDYIFENLDTVNIMKTHAAANSTTGEIAFYFPPADALLPAKNLLASSQDFGNAVWVPTAVTAGSTGSVIAPDGSTTTTQGIIESAVNNIHEIEQRGFQKLGEPEVFTFSVYAHRNSTRNIVLRGDRSGATGFVVIFDPTTGNVVLNNAIRFVVNNAASTTDSFATGFGTGGNGWLRYTVTFTTDDGPSFDLGIALASGNQRSYLGNGTSEGYFWGAQLDAGGAALFYNATTAAPPKNEPTKYIKYNTQTPAWDSGTLTRTAWIDQSIWGQPLGADANQLVQQHERGFDDDGSPMRDVFVESGFTQIGDGSMMLSVHQCLPDFKWLGNNGEVQIRLKAKSYPDDQEPVAVYGPFSVTPTTRFFDPRLRGRYVAIRYDWSPILGFSARVGNVTYRMKPTGRRP